MRTLAVAVLTGFTALAVASSAGAAPTLSLVWSGTTGTGATGGSTIAASIGDTLTVDVILTIDPTGFTGAAWDLVGTGGFLANTNINITPFPGAGGPPECPAPPNLAPGTCFSVTFKTYSALAVGVVDAGSSTTGYDVAGLTAEFTPSTMTIGRGTFTVVSGSSETISTFFAPGVGGVTNGVFGFSIPAVSTITAIIPEPGTAGLMGLGLLALGVVGRRRN